MLSYVALAWNSTETEVSREAERVEAKILEKLTSWAVEFKRPGLWVFLPSLDPSRPPTISLRNGSGIILGTVFPFPNTTEASSAVRCVELSHRNEYELLKSEGRSIIKSHWGSYVLFLCDPASANVRVLRGPMSALPCFWVKISRLTIFFSRPADLANCALVPFGINWDYVLAQSMMGDYLCEETGLRGVRTLVSGDCAAITSGELRRRTYWTPFEVNPEMAASNFDSATRLLRTVTRSVINSWSSLHKSIIVSLSGGFDSSVVLSCAMKAPSAAVVRAVNLYFPSVCDERRYARSMAGKFGVPLSEIRLPSDVDLSAFLRCARTASPVLNFGAFATESVYLLLSQKHNATAVFTGELGDSIFGHAYGPELLAEALWRYSLTPSMLRVAMQYAILNRISVWRAMRRAMFEYYLYRKVRFTAIRQRLRARGTPPDIGLLTDEASARYEQIQSRFIHPWFNEIAEGPPGWLQLVPGMIMCTSTWTHSGFSDSIDTLVMHPLASQPLVEAFLAIPSEYHIVGGKNAAVARASFAGQLSPEVLSRGTGKCTSGLWLEDIIFCNRAFLREFLLDGVLVRERLLDRRKTEDALSDKVDCSKTRVSDIVALLYIESWLRQWIRSFKNDTEHATWLAVQ